GSAVLSPVLSRRSSEAHRRRSACTLEASTSDEWRANLRPSGPVLGDRTGPGRHDVGDSKMHAGMRILKHGAGTREVSGIHDELGFDSRKLLRKRFEDGAR